MATNPYFTQYHTQRFSFIGSPQQRDGTYQKDQRFLNLYPELITSPISDGKKYYLKKRPGTILFQSFSPTFGTGQGIHYWPANGTFYTAVGGHIWAGGSSIITLTTATGPVGFAEYINGTTNQLIVVDGAAGWIINTDNTFTQITDGNFPNPHIPNPIFLDGYIFLAKAGTATIKNSALLNPGNWPSDGFIDAEMFPDKLVALAKTQNYIAAIGLNSIEWFYDNANATGSPLQRNAPAVSQIGCPAPQTVYQTEKELTLVGQTGNGGRTVWVIDGFQPTEIANAPVREALDLEAEAISQAVGFGVQCEGHKWYILSLATAGRTFVYDYEEKMWHEWSYTTAQQRFNFMAAADSVFGRPVLLSFSDGISVILDSQAFTDYNFHNPATPLAINCQATTIKLDFDTIKRKRMYRLSLIADSPAPLPGPIMTVAFSDNDYTTFGTPLNLITGPTYPTITQLGYFRRRAFQFTFQQPWPLRMESFEVDIIQEVRR